MSSSRLRVALLVVVPALAGCETTGLHPLYMSKGGNVQPLLASIVVDPIPDRFGHYLSDKLMTDLNGTGENAPPRYHLTVVPHLATQAPLINTVSQIATAATITTTATYRLVPVGGGEPVAQGTVTSAADYDRSLQRFANIRAARDAEIRNADTLAEQITQQIAAQLATH
jgi:LPS-assembly lipoprotein